MVRNNAVFLCDTVVGGPFESLCEADFLLSAATETLQHLKKKVLEF